MICANYTSIKKNLSRGKKNTIFTGEHIVFCLPHECPYAITQIPLRLELNRLIKGHSAHISCSPACGLIPINPGV